MDPSVALSNLGQLIAGLIGVLVLTAIVLALLPVGECDRCPHCRQERLRKRDEQDQLAARLFGIRPTIEFCKLHQRPRHECRDEEHE